MKSLSFISVLGLSLISFNSFAQDSQPTSTSGDVPAGVAKEPNQITVQEPPEEEGGISYGAEADFNAIYTWRGIALSAGPVAQPSAWLSAGGATFSAWSSFTTNGNDGFGFQELDLIGEYELEGPAGFTVIPRVIGYIVPEASVGEIELELDHDIAGPVGVYLINSVGFAGSPGSYFGQLGLSVAHDLDVGLSLEASAALALGNGIFNDFNVAVDKTGLNAALVGAAGTYSFLDGLVYARLHAELQAALDGDIKAGLDKPLVINGGLALGFEM